MSVGASIGFRFDDHIADRDADRLAEVVGNLVGVRFAAARNGPFDCSVERLDGDDRRPYYVVRVAPLEPGLHLGLRRELRDTLDALGRATPEALQQELDAAVANGWEPRALTADFEMTQKFEPLDLPDSMSLRNPLHLKLGTEASRWRGWEVDPGPSGSLEQLLGPRRRPDPPRKGA